jgi:hypothetical protein
VRHVGLALRQAVGVILLGVQQAVHLVLLPENQQLGAVVDLVQPLAVGLACKGWARCMPSSSEPVLSAASG